MAPITLHLIIRWLLAMFRSAQVSLVKKLSIEIILYLNISYITDGFFLLRFAGFIRKVGAFQTLKLNFKTAEGS